MGRNGAAEPPRFRRCIAHRHCMQRACRAAGASRESPGAVAAARSRAARFQFEIYTGAVSAAGRPRPLDRGDAQGRVTGIIAAFCAASVGDWAIRRSPRVALVWAYVNATYELLRPKLTNLTESIASTAEKFLQVRTQRIVQELRPIALDPDAAASLAAPVGSPAILVWRCYYLDNDDLFVVSRSIYPQDRMVFRTELTRSERS